MSLQSFLGIGQSTKVDIEITNEADRRSKTVTNPDGTIQELPIFYDGESVTGKVTVNVKRSSKFEHQGIRISFLGIMENIGDRASRTEFVSLSQDLARPGVLQQPVTYPFEFLMVDKPYESYSGTLVKIKYVIRVTIVKRMTNIVKDREILVNSLAYYSDLDSSIKMEVGIEESLHIEFEYEKSRYHLNDVIIGKIFFILVRVKIKNMELHIVKKETTGYGVNTYSDNETIAKFEIMDGAPVKGESIPIRLFLSQYDLTPSIHDQNKKFSVRYLLNLVLLDEEDRRYYKHQEILIYRKNPRKRRQYAQINRLKDGSVLPIDRKISTVTDGSEDGSAISSENYNRVERSLQRYDPDKFPEGAVDPSIASVSENGNGNGDDFASKEKENDLPVTKEQMEERESAAKPTPPSSQEQPPVVVENEEVPPVPTTKEKPASNDVFADY